MALRPVILVGALLLAAAAQAYAQDPQGGGGGGRGGRGGIRGQGPGPYPDPSQLPDPSQFPGGFGRGRFGGAPRDDQAPQGTARITGRVVSTDTGNPLRRAQVRLTATDVRVNRVVSTDNDGKYEFTGLAAARYRLQISKAGFVTLEYGQARPFEAGKPLDIADGQALERIDFSLPRGSVIAGRVTDEFGEPVADASVQALRYQFVNGQRQLTPIGRPGTSDDIGQYRIFGLMPGEYIVRASLRDMTGAGPATPTSEAPSGYPATYYPGTTDASQAQAVNVALGQELSSVFFALIPARLARITGNVIDSQGRPLTGALVVVRPSDGARGTGLFNIGGGNQVRNDGTFTINNVPPGEYTLDVQQRPRDLQSLGTTQLEFASQTLTVAGADISGLSLVTSTGVSVNGRVVLEGQNAQKTPLRGVQITAAAASGNQSLIGIAGRALGSGRVNDDATFELRGLAGPEQVRVANVPNGWMLKSIALEGQDITDSAFDFKTGRNFTGMVVTLTDKLTAVSGTVHDARGSAVNDYVVVAFPEDTKLWTGQSRYVRIARPNQQGAFEFKGLPPSKYLFTALDGLENGSQYDPAVLERLKARATSLSLAEGQSQTLNLSLVTGQ
jgi:Carboxypeptidase regulatory-like domain